MTKTIDSDAVINSILLTEQGSAPTTPGAGLQKLYAKTTGLHRVNSAGDSIPVTFIPEPGGRLTLTSGTPVTTSDVTAATSVWYQPYKHDYLPLWDGSDFIPVVFTAAPISLAGLSGSSTVDVFSYLNGAVPAYETSMWTSPTVRATGLVYQNGRLVKSGDSTRLYLGSLYINSSGGQTDDAIAKRFVWNYYNRRYRSMFKTDATAHTYGTATARSWNNDAAQRVEYVCGVLEDTMDWSIQSYVDYTGQDSIVAIAFDATNNVTSSDRMIVRSDLNSGAIMFLGMGWTKKITSELAIGYHYLQAVEYAGGNTDYKEFRLAAGLWG